MLNGARASSRTLLADYLICFTIKRRVGASLVFRLPWVVGVFIANVVFRLPTPYPVRGVETPIRGRWKRRRGIGSRLGQNF